MTQTVTQRLDAIEYLLRLDETWKIDAASDFVQLFGRMVSIENLGSNNQWRITNIEQGLGLVPGQIQDAIDEKTIHFDEQAQSTAALVAQAMEAAQLAQDQVNQAYQDVIENRNYIETVFASANQTWEQDLSFAFNQLREGLDLDIDRSKEDLEEQIQQTFNLAQQESADIRMKLGIVQQMVSNAGFIRQRTGDDLNGNPTIGGWTPLNGSSTPVSIQILHPGGNPVNVRAIEVSHAGAFETPAYVGFNLNGREFRFNGWVQTEPGTTLKLGIVGSLLGQSDQTETVLGESVVIDTNGAWVEVNESFEVSVDTEMWKPAFLVNGSKARFWNLNMFDHNMSIEAAMIAANLAKENAELARDQAIQIRDQSEAFALATEAAKIASQLARDQAQTSAQSANEYSSSAAGFAQTAETHSTDAADSASAAAASVVSAQTARNDSEGFASASSSSAISAATEAGNAYQSAAAASTARNEAETARSQAETFRDEAATARDSAESSAASATSSAGLAATAKTDAEDAASASFESAQTAAAEAMAAQQSASASDTSRVDAQTARNQSEGFRNQAVTAKESAEEASAVATSKASLSATSANQAENSASAAASSASTASSKATEAESSASAAQVSLTEAETARSSAENFRDEAVSAKENAEVAASNALTHAGIAAASASNAGDSASAAAQSASTADTRATDALVSANAANADRILVETARQGAEEYASAAAGSASAASSSSSNAAQSASAANTAYLNADTSRASAETARDQAVTARQNAETALSTATTQADISTSAANLAGQHATSASNSATAAVSEASAAAQSASLATTAKNEAQTARNQAETFRNESLTAKEDAESASSSANSSAGLAATSANNAGTSASAAADTLTMVNTVATEVNQDAAVATAERGLAQTARSEAETFRNQAVVARNNAESSASSAQQISGVVTNLVSSVPQLPSTFEAQGSYWVQAVGGSFTRESTPPSRVLFGTDAVFGSYARFTELNATSTYNLAPRGALALNGLTRLRATLRLRKFGNYGASNPLRLRIQYLDAEFNGVEQATAIFLHSEVANLADGEVTTLVWEGNYDGPAKWARFFISKAGWVTDSHPDAYVDISLLKMEDITEIHEVNSSATNAMQSAVDANQAIAQISQTVAAEYGDWEAFVENTSQAVTTADQVVARQFIGVTGSGSEAGLELLAWNAASGSGSAISLNADNVLIDGTLSTSKLVVTDFSGNLVPNGSFVSGDLRGWSDVHSSFSVVSLANSPTFMVLKNDRTGVIETSLNATMAKDIPVTPGEIIYVSFRHRGSSGASGTFRVWFDWINASNQIIFDTPPISVMIDSNENWVNRESSKAAPSGAVKLNIRLERVSGSGVGYVTKFEVTRKKGAAVLITPQSITGSLIAAENVITNSAQIGNAVIDTANIKDLSVDTLQIADFAVTEDVTSFRQENVTGIGVSPFISNPDHWVEYDELIVTVPNADTRIQLMVNFTFQIISGSPGWTRIRFRDKTSGGSILNHAYSSGYYNDMTTLIAFAFRNAGTYDFAVEFQSPTNVRAVRALSIISQRKK